MNGSLDLVILSTPLATERHSSVPARLTKEAAAARSKLYGNRTLPRSEPGL